MSRGSRYAATTDSENGTLDHLSKELAGRLRKNVQKIAPASAFTKDWVDMIHALADISNIAMMEHRLPRSDADATLWEGDELTVRFLLEEGKLNLCLRLINEYSLQMRAHLLGTKACDEWAAGAGARVGLDADAFKAKLVQFEQSLGSLLDCALQHVEATQTIEVPLLLEHVALVLRSAAESPAPESAYFERTQPFYVLRYLESLGKRMDGDQRFEDQVTGLVAQHGIVPSAIGHLLAYANELGPAGQTSAVVFLAKLFDSEDFHTNEDVRSRSRMPALSACAASAHSRPPTERTVVARHSRHAMPGHTAVRCRASQHCATIAVALRPRPPEPLERATCTRMYMRARRASWR